MNAEKIAQHPVGKTYKEKVHRLAFGLEGAFDREYNFAEHVIKKANG